MKVEIINEYVSAVLEYRISKVALRADGILHISIKPEEEFTLDDYKELMDAALKIGNGRKFLNLISVGQDTIPDHETRNMSTSQKGSIYKIADAFVIHSLPQKLIGNFYMNFHKPVVPTRFFTKEEEAIEWLMKFKK